MQKDCKIKEKKIKNLKILLENAEKENFHNKNETINFMEKIEYQNLKINELMEEIRMKEDFLREKAEYIPNENEKLKTMEETIKELKNELRVIEYDRHSKFLDIEKLHKILQILTEENKKILSEKKKLESENNFLLNKKLNLNQINQQKIEKDQEFDRFKSISSDKNYQEDENLIKNVIQSKENDLENIIQEFDEEIKKNIEKIEKFKKMINENSLSNDNLFLEMNDFIKENEYIILEKNHYLKLQKKLNNIQIELNNILFEINNKKNSVYFNSLSHSKICSPKNETLFNNEMSFSEIEEINKFIKLKNQKNLIESFEKIIKNLKRQKNAGNLRAEKLEKQVILEKELNKVKIEELNRELEKEKDEKNNKQEYLVKEIMKKNKELINFEIKFKKICISQNSILKEKENIKTELIEKNQLLKIIESNFRNLGEDYQQYQEKNNEEIKICEEKLYVFELNAKKYRKRIRKRKRIKQ